MKISYNMFWSNSFPILPPTPPRSIHLSPTFHLSVLYFQIINWALFVLSLHCLCNVICWSLIHLPKVTALMKTHPQKPIAPQVSVGAQKTFRLCAAVLTVFTLNWSSSGNWRWCEHAYGGPVMFRRHYFSTVLPDAWLLQSSFYHLCHDLWALAWVWNLYPINNSALLDFEQL